MVYELERVLRVCNGFLCSMSVTCQPTNMIETTYFGSIVICNCEDMKDITCFVIALRTALARQETFLECLTISDVIAEQRHDQT